MKRNLLFVAIIAFVCGMSSCKSKEFANDGKINSAMDNSRTSLDWDGTYSGVVPSSDSPDVAIELKLNSDFSYEMKRTCSQKEISFISAGAFTWNPAGNGIILQNVNAKGSFEYFSVQENQLLMLDKNGKRISGKNASKYILKKRMVEAPSQDSKLTNKYWKLVELMGDPITYAEGATKEAFISFNEDGTVNGNFGCNNFSGTYTLQDGNKILFSRMAATMMMCMDNMEVEGKFMQVLEMADNYNLNADKLVLNKARMAPLARFEVVHK